MTDFQSIIRSNDFLFKRAIYGLLDTFKREVVPEDFASYIARLDASFDSLPNNQLAESRKFFNQMAMMIFERLSPYYQVSVEESNRAGYAKNVFHFQMLPEYKEKNEVFKKYRNTNRFVSSFLNRHNSNFYRHFRNMRVDSSLNRRGELLEDGSVHYLANKIKTDTDLFLPVDSNGGLIGTSYRMDYFKELKQLTDLEIEFVAGLNTRYDELITAIDAFEEEMAEFIRESYLSFGYEHMKEILSIVILPLHVIQNKKIVEECNKQSRKVFVLPPGHDEVIPLGLTVHVYAAHDLSDDSFVMKPVLVQDETPSDTEELKYLGVGQYTQYDNSSSRSLNGESPYVINGNIYAKASLEDFIQAYPDELVAHMEACQQILDFLGLTEDDLIIEEEPQYTKAIENLKNLKVSSREVVIGSFLTTMAEMKETMEKMKENDSDSIENIIHSLENIIRPSQNDIYTVVNNSRSIENVIYPFESTDITINPQLFMRKPPHYQPFAIFYDLHNDSFIAAKLTQSSTIEVFTAENGAAACRALGLANGVYTVYSYSRREYDRAFAMYSVYSYNEHPEEES